MLRKRLDHSIPGWVEDQALFFITVCLAERGSNRLCLGEMPQIVLNAARFYHSRHRWHAQLVLLMPDHLHALISFPNHETMSLTVGQWKGYLAKNHGIQWQEDFFDHRLRQEESVDEKARYILENPVRQGLVDRIDDWPHWWRPSD